MRVLYSKPRRLSPADEAADGLEYRGLDDLLRESDFVAINAAYGPETHHLIGEREIGLMKPSAYIINTARGPIIDEAALVSRATRRTDRRRGAGRFRKRAERAPGFVEARQRRAHAASRQRERRYAHRNCGLHRRQRACIHEFPAKTQEILVSQKPKMIATTRFVG